MIREAKTGENGKIDTSMGRLEEDNRKGCNQQLEAFSESN
jgi:hypothetical protein